MIISEATGLNVVSVLVPSEAQNGRKLAILHLSTIDPREAISGLEAAGYTVGWPSLAASLRQPGSESTYQ